MNDTNQKFCVIFDWMFKDMGLNGNSAIIYAVIYHFSLGEHVAIP